MKILKNIVDEKQVGIKETTKIISSLDAYQKLLVSEVLKLVKLIVVQSQILPAIIYDHLERLSSCLIVTTYKKQVYKLRLVEEASRFCFEIERRFSI